MATTPGILTEWPWKPLGNFKYLVVVPGVIHSTYSYFSKEKEARDLTYFLIPVVMMSRAIHDQLWISLSRHRTAKGTNRILDKGVDFDQVDRESNWDDQILLSGLIMYISYYMFYPHACHLPLWKTSGLILTVLLHAGPVEFLYYWFHRALHHHYLYNRYHSHHHSSVVTEPITSVIHPFAEILSYFVLFYVPMGITLVTDTASLASVFGYLTYIDFMNNMGHCNFEHVPKRLFTVFPFLKYLIYTPSFHSLHHTQFRANYSLFMPIYDYIYDTVDKSSDTLYEDSLKRPAESPDVVDLVHLTTPESIYHLQVGLTSFASKPYSSRWYIWAMWPITVWSSILTWAYRRSFVSERFSFQSLKFQSWVIPKYKIQYSSHWQREAINGMIEQSIVEADAKGVKVLSLGLLNQGEELNVNGEIFVQRYPDLKTKLVDGSSLAVGEELNVNGEIFVQRYPDLKTKLVDGSSLAVAVVLNSIPEGTTEVLFRGNITKVARAVASSLFQRGVQVATLYEHEKKKLGLTTSIDVNPRSNELKIWLVGDGLTNEEQMRAPNGTSFIPFSQFPPQNFRRDCFYYTTPAMAIPTTFVNLNTCENWLPRNVMSAWRIAGILHALEGWNEHEVGHAMFDVQKVWESSLNHGFRPFINASIDGCTYQDKLKGA